MPRQPRLDLADTLYHVMARGVAKGDTFLTDGDRFDFLRRLAKLQEPEDITLFAFVLMHNHFHLILRRGRRRLGLFMKRLLTGYAVTFNLRHERVGHLFQNRFKSIPCEEERYLLELVRYVHLNPVRAGLVTDPLQYRWSSHAAYMGLMSFPWLNVEEVLRLVGGQRGYEELIAATVDSGASTGRGRGGVPELSGHGSRPLGSEPFQQRIFAAADQIEPADQYTSRDEIMSAVTTIVASRTGVTLGPGRSVGRSRLVARARAAFITEAVVVRGLRPIDVSRYLGISPAAVTRHLRQIGDVV